MSWVYTLVVDWSPARHASLGVRAFIARCLFHAPGGIHAGTATSVGEPSCFCNRPFRSPFSAVAVSSAGITTWVSPTAPDSAMNSCYLRLSEPAE